MKKREERLSPKGTPRWAGHERQWTCWLRPETHRITTDGDRLIDVVYFEFIQASFSRPTPFACSLNGVPSAGNVWSKERPGVFFCFLFCFILFFTFGFSFVFFSLSLLVGWSLRSRFNLRTFHFPPRWIFFFRIDYWNCRRLSVRSDQGQTKKRIFLIPHPFHRSRTLSGVLKSFTFSNS